MLYGLLALAGIYVISRRSFTIWRDDVKKYLTRWYIVGRWFREAFKCRPYLHHFHASDDAELHDHLWVWSYSLVLWGGYTERRLTPHVVNRGTPSETVVYVPDTRVYKPGSINRLNSNCFHRVDLLNEKRGCWTLFLAGPHDKTKPDWGFLRSDGSVEYAFERFTGKRDSLSDD